MQLDVTKDLPHLEEVKDQELEVLSGGIKSVESFSLTDGEVEQSTNLSSRGITNDMDMWQWRK